MIIVFSTSKQSCGSLESTVGVSVLNTLLPRRFRHSQSFSVVIAGTVESVIRQERWSDPSCAILIRGQRVASRLPRFFLSSRTVIRFWQRLITLTAASVVIRSWQRLITAARDD